MYIDHPGQSNEKTADMAVRPWLTITITIT